MKLQLRLRDDPMSRTLQTMHCSMVTDLLHFCDTPACRPGDWRIALEIACSGITGSRHWVGYCDSGQWELADKSTALSGRTLDDEPGVMALEYVFDDRQTEPYASVFATPSRV